MKISPFKVEEWMNQYESSALYDLTTTCIKPLTISELCKDINIDIFDVPVVSGNSTYNFKDI